MEALEGNKIKVAIFGPEMHLPLIEGIQKTSVEFTRQLIEAGYGVRVFTQLSFGSLDHELEPAVFLINSESSKILRFFYWFIDSFKISRLIAQEGIKEVFVFSLDLSFLIPLIFIALFCPEIRVRLFLFSPRELNFLPSKLFLKLFHNKISHFIVRSEYMKERLVQLGIVNHKISVSLPFPNKSRFFLPHKGEYPKSLGYLSSAQNKAGIEVILGLSNLLKDYIFFLAIRDFDNVKEEILLRELMKREKNGNLRILRNIENVPSFLSSLGGIILPPEKEDYSMDMPMLMIESFALKVPVFVRDLPMFKGLSESGMVKSFVNIEDLKEKILEGYDNKAINKAHEFASSLPDIREFTKEITGIDYEK